MEKNIMKAIIWDLEFNQLRIVLLAILAWVQMSPGLTIEDIATIVDEARAN